MGEPFQLMTKPQLKATIQKMERAAEKAAEANNTELEFKILTKITDLAFILHPEWDRRKAVKPPTKKNGAQLVNSDEPTNRPEEELGALRGLSDDELERSLGR